MDFKRSTQLGARTVKPEFCGLLPHEFIERFAGTISLLQWLVATACVLFVVIALYLVFA